MTCNKCILGMLKIIMAGTFIWVNTALAEPPPSCYCADGNVYPSLSWSYPWNARICDVRCGGTGREGY